MNEKDEGKQATHSMALRYSESSRGGSGRVTTCCDHHLGGLEAGSHMRLDCRSMTVSASSMFMPGSRRMAPPVSLYKSEVRMTTAELDWTGPARRKEGRKESTSK